MNELNVMELEAVAGGDAAATRLPGTNSWGETAKGAAYNNAGPLRRMMDEWIDRIIGA